jgi:hypothetical protein
MRENQTKPAPLGEYSPEYAPLSPVQQPKWRVKSLLTKLESDRKNGTDYFSSKFAAKLNETFTGLPKPKEWLIRSHKKTFPSYSLRMKFSGLL